MSRSHPAVLAMVCVAMFFLVPVDAQEADRRTSSTEKATASTEKATAVARLRTDATGLLKTYCFDCHGNSSGEGGLDLSDLLDKGDFDGNLVFENLMTAKMPPEDSERPSTAEKRLILNWLATRQVEDSRNSYRRISRHEFVHSVNDLLGTKLNIAESIPEDRGTNDFDSNRKIMLTREMLAAYFSAADEILEFAFPEEGFPEERSWTTKKIKDSDSSYSLYVRNYKEGLLFSWTRANNGNNYSFFYDNFEPPEKGWYELTFDAAKLGEFDEDVSVLVYAGKYYFADDRPQPQRLLGVISLGENELKSHRLQVFLRPGENVSVHCYSKHTWRQNEGEQGAYIKQLEIRGPVHEQWPPESYRTVFAGLPLDAPDRGVSDVPGFKTAIVVSSKSPDDLRTVIKRFAENAFSTTLTEEELAPYYQVSLNALAEHGDFTRATKQGLKAVLLSHRFLLAPGVHRNRSYRASADLARSLWLSVPDQQLLELASTDSLSAETVPAEIHRMLNDPRSQRMVHSFCDQWLNLRSFNKVSPSLKLYPGYDDLLNHYLPLETKAYLKFLIDQNMPISYLIDSDFSILNQRLAQHYGVEGVIGQDMRKVSFNSQTPRGGLLTMGSVLKVTTDGFHTSPILRGAWISRNIAGNTLSPPPESVEAIEADANHATTLKEQIEEHKNSATCYACHKSIDPYGFALESFDATGQWRTKYRVEIPHSSTFQYRPQGYFVLAGDVDASGQVGESRFEDILGLKKILLNDHKKIAYNFAKKFFEYANGHQPTLKQRIDLHEMISNQAEDCRIKDLVTDVLTYSFLGDHR